MSPVAQVLVTMEDPYVTAQLQELAELSGTTETTLASGSADAQQPAGDMVMLRTARPMSAEQQSDELPLGAPPPPPPPTGARSQSS